MKKNNGQPFIMGANGKEIPDYIQQRKEDYTKAKEREREAAKVKSSNQKKKEKHIEIILKLDSCFKEKSSYRYSNTCSSCSFTISSW